MENVTIRDIVSAVGGTYLGPEHLENAPVTTLCYDSRKLKAEDLYLPLVGERVNGHIFIQQVLEEGAIGSFTMEDLSEYRPDKAYIKVPDTAKVPRALAEWYRAKFHIPFIAVTGSVGKTTTKDMVSAVLSEKFRVHKTPENHNNGLGVPMALLDLSFSHQAAVIEMGMNSFGEIDNLSDLVKPDMALITNIGDAHIENLGSREGILKAKSEVFGHMDPHAPAILNGDDALLMTLKKKLDRSIITCGKGSGCDFYVTDQDRDLITEDLRCTLHSPLGQIGLTIPALGDYMVYPVLMAAAVGQKLGMSLDEIARGVLRYAPTKMRMNVVDRGMQVRILDDAYNANPQSMRAGIQTLASTGRDYTVAILGDMLELGSMGPMLHAAVGSALADGNIQCLVAIGELSEHMAKAADDAQVPEVYWFPTKKEALPTIAKLVRPNSAILVKASRRMEFEEIVQYLISITPEKEG